MSTFNADDITGKSLIAKAAVNAYKSPSSISPLYASFKTGQTIGVVYSWINKGGKLFWMFYDSKNSPYYVEHSEGKFSITALVDQGTKTTKQKTQEKIESEKSLGDKLGENLLSFTGIVKWVLIAAIVAFLLYEGYKAGMLKSVIK